jgi:hypothetical protein
VDWAQPFADLESCWKACPYPECLLWLAARLSTTAGERRAVVSCLAEITRRAGRGSRETNADAECAVLAAEAWAHAEASLEELLAAERAAQDAVARAAVLAAHDAALARAMFRFAPRRGRPASGRTSQAFGALATWRETEHAWRLTRAAAGAARAAARGAEADALDAGDAGHGEAEGDDAGSAPHEPGSAGGSWVACVSESAGYAVSALAGGRAGRAARKSAQLIRRRLPCPALA